MTSPTITTPLKGFRHPREIISYAVWAYLRFSMSLRDVEDLLARRGIIVSYETIRVWVDRFGHQFARFIRRDRPAPNGKWHLDEMVITIKGDKYWLWRAVDASGDVLDILMQSRRNADAAMRFMRKLLKKYGRPRVVVTDKLGSYGCALRHLIPSTDHRSHKGLNNRAEASHRHTRRREKIMGRFKSPGQTQKFLAAHDQITTLFRPHRHTLSAVSYRHARADAFTLWGDYAGELVA